MSVLAAFSSASVESGAFAAREAPTYGPGGPHPGAYGSLVTANRFGVPGEPGL